MQKVPAHMNLHFRERYTLYEQNLMYVSQMKKEKRYGEGKMILDLEHFSLNPTLFYFQKLAK